MLIHVDEGKNDKDRKAMPSPGLIDLLRDYWREAQPEDWLFPGHSFTVLEVRSALQHHLGRSIKITGFPWWMFRIFAPFWELVREMNEMRYLWNTSHQLSGEKFNWLLPDFVPADMRRVVLCRYRMICTPTGLRQINAS